MVISREYILLYIRSIKYENTVKYEKTLGDAPHLEYTSIRREEKFCIFTWH
jgi:hypothetical protein